MKISIPFKAKAALVQGRPARRTRRQLAKPEHHSSAATTDRTGTRPDRVRKTSCGNASHVEAKAAPVEPKPVKKSMIQDPLFGDINFVIYSDGSVIVQLAEGPYKFSSEKELREYLDNAEPRINSQPD